MRRSFSISAGAHALVLLWLLVGNVFRPDPPEFEVSNVSVISEAEFSAMTDAAQAPEVQTEVTAPVEAPEPAPGPEPTPEPEPQPEQQPNWVKTAKSRPILLSIGERLVAVLPEDPEKAILDKIRQNNQAGGGATPTDEPAYSDSERQGLEQLTTDSN